MEHDPMTTKQIGTIRSLWLYPVKSMAGESLSELTLMATGAIGDRIWALVDTGNGMVVSAKNPNKWPELLECRARYLSPPQHRGSPSPVEITLANGTTVRSDQKDIDEVLSDCWNRPVQLTASPPREPLLEQYLMEEQEILTEAIPEGTFFDVAPIHLLTTATLRRLQQCLAKGAINVRRFRPNLVLDCNGSEFLEGQWLGCTIEIGSEVRLKLTSHCPRCIMTTLGQGDLPKDAEVLRSIARENQGRLGAYAMVLQGGAIGIDDPVRIVSE